MEKLPGYDAWKLASPDESEEDDDRPIWNVKATMYSDLVLFETEIVAEDEDEAREMAEEIILNSIRLTIKGR